MRQAARGEEDIDRCDQVAGHRGQRAGKPSAPEKVVLREWRHQQVGQRQPDITELGEAGVDIVDDARAISRCECASAYRGSSASGRPRRRADTGADGADDEREKPAIVIPARRS